MKRTNIYYFIIIIMLVGCKSEKNISFCEGVSPEGEKINCGKKFTTGDLTLIIEIDKPFEADKLNIEILEIKKYKDERVQSFSFTIKPEERRANTDISFYNEGQYRVTVSDKDKNRIAEGEVTIIDTY